MPTSLTTLVAVGAYGRDYHSRNAALLLQEWTEGKDFKICNGPYFSIRDVPRLLQEGYVQSVPPADVLEFIGNCG